MKTTIIALCIMVCLFVIGDLVYLTVAFDRLKEHVTRVSPSFYNVTVNEVAKRRQVLTEKSELSELEGFLQRNIKWTSPYTLRIDGNGVSECYLAGAVLDGIPDGTHVRVKGKLTTYRYLDEANEPAISCFPLHWGILMNVEEVTMTPDPFKKDPPSKGQQPAGADPARPRPAQP